MAEVPRRDARAEVDDFARVLRLPRGALDPPTGVQAARGRGREVAKVNGPHLVTLVRAGAKFVNGTIEGEGRRVISRYALPQLLTVFLTSLA